MIGTKSRASPDAAFAPGSYHTDGQRLLRIAGPAIDGELVPVEDSRTLDILLVPVGELAALGLKPVVAGAPSA